MNTILVYGGSFNPIHNGHIKVIRECQKAYPNTGIFVSPCESTPYEKSLIDLEHRRIMCERATLYMPGVWIWNFKPTTYETLTHLRTLRPNINYKFVIGADQVSKVPTWFEYERLTSEFSFVILKRPKYKIEEEWCNDPRHTILNIKGNSISSTKVREDILTKGFSKDVPKPIMKYIKENGLYV